MPGPHRRSSPTQLMNDATDDQPTRSPHEPPDRQPWWLDGDTSPSIAELPPEAAPVATVEIRAVPHLRSPSVEDRPILHPFPSLVLADYSIVFTPRAMMSRGLLVVAIGFVPFVLGSGHLAVPVAVAAAAVMLMRNVAGRVTFTFAEGFLAFRQPTGWPIGVQEEYDVTWDWSTAPR